MLNFATWPQIDGRDNPLLRSPGDMSRLAEASFAHRLELHSLTTVSLKTAPLTTGPLTTAPGDDPPSFALDDDVPQEIPLADDPLRQTFRVSALYNAWRPKMIAADADSARIAEYRPARCGEHTYHVISDTAHGAAIQFSAELLHNVADVGDVLPAIGEPLERFIARRWKLALANSRENLPKHAFDQAELKRMIARMSREIVLLFDHAGTPLPEFATVANVAEWTGLEIKSLDRYRPRWSPVVAAKGRGQNRTLFHRDKLIAILREQFPDIAFPA
jgi:hypothetical protein